MHDLSRFLQPVPGLFVGGATRIGLGTRLVPGLFVGGATRIGLGTRLEIDEPGVEPGSNSVVMSLV